MTLIRNISTSWSDAVTLSFDEVWQARKATVFLSTQTAPGPDDGIVLVQGKGLRFSAGTQLRYRKGSLTDAMIVREGIVAIGTGIASEPAQVTGITVAPGDGQNDLAWSVPADGGAPITDYVIEVDSGAGFSTLADGVSTATSYIHTGLSNGTAYAYRLSAVNSVGAGPVSAVASATPVASSVAPVNTGLPAIRGSYQTGQVLSVSEGTWTGNPTPAITYQWTRGGVDITDATSSTYTLVAADEGSVIGCPVTGTNSAGAVTVGATGENKVAASAPVAGWVIDANTNLTSAPDAPSPPILIGEVITDFVGAFAITSGGTASVANGASTALALTADEAGVTWGLLEDVGDDDQEFTVSGSNLNFSTGSGASGIYTTGYDATNGITTVTQPLEVEVAPATVYGANDVLLIPFAGQSNNLGVGSRVSQFRDAGLVYPAADTEAYQADGTFAAGDFGALSESISYQSFDYQIAVDLLRLHPGVKIVFCQVAEGGTGFFGNRWNPGDDLYNAFVARTNAAATATAARYPGRTMHLWGIVWHQGEADTTNPDHATALDAMIAQVRTDITTASATTPFLLGELVDDTRASQAVIRDTPNRVAYTGVAESYNAKSGDGLHYDYVARNAIGRRYVWAHDRVIRNTGA